MSSSQITADELVRLRQELADLEGRGRREVAERIKVAREWGDISENSEYDAAKNEQAMLEARIAKLRERSASSVVVDSSRSTDEVALGCVVTFTDQDRGDSKTFRLVSSYEAAPADGKLSIASPIGEALLHAKVGDIVQVRSPKGIRALHITAIA